MFRECNYFLLSRCMHRGVHIAKDWNRFGLMLLNICTQHRYVWDELIALGSLMWQMHLKLKDFPLFYCK